MALSTGKKIGIISGTAILVAVVGYIILKRRSAAAMTQVVTAPTKQAPIIEPTDTPAPKSEAPVVHKDTPMPEVFKTLVLPLDQIKWTTH